MSLFTFLEFSENDVMSFDLTWVWGAFVVSLLLKIDIDGSLSSSEFLSKFVGMVSSSKNNPNCFFYWFVIQLFHYIFTSFEYCLVGRRMCFNADLKSYL